MLGIFEGHGWVGEKQGLARGVHRRLLGHRDVLVCFLRVDGSHGIWDIPYELELEVSSTTFFCWGRNMSDRSLSGLFFDMD